MAETWRGQVREGGEDAGGPIAAGHLGDGKQRTPVVTQTVEGGFGHDWITGLDGREVVLRPAGEFAAKFSFNFGLELVEMSDDLAFFGFDQVDANGTVTQCGGQCTDAGEDGGSK